jgi:hypothetical protein
MAAGNFPVRGFFSRRVDREKAGRTGAVPRRERRTGAQNEKGWCAPALFDGPAERRLTL